MRGLGRLFQITGLVLPLLGIVLQLTGFSVAGMLFILVLGVGLFWVGRLIEGYSGR